MTFLLLTFGVTLGYTWPNFNKLLEPITDGHGKKEFNLDLKDTVASSDFQFYHHPVREDVSKESDKSIINKNKSHSSSSQDSTEENIDDDSEVREALNLKENSNKDLYISEENKKIKKLLAELNRLPLRKSITAKKIQDLNINKILKEAIIQQWREIEIVVKLLLIDNYRHVKQVLLREIINNQSAGRGEIKRLERKLLQSYYILKKDLIKTIKVERIKFKKEVSKINNKQEIYEIQKLYLSKLKEQIDKKIEVFKETIDSIIKQFHLSLKPVTDYSTTTQKISATNVNTDIPFDPVYESTSTENIIGVHADEHSSTATYGHITIEELPISSLTEIDNTHNAESTATDTGKKIFNKFKISVITYVVR